MAVNTCQHCQRQFACKRRDKRFCTPTCQWVASQEKSRSVPMPSETMIALGLALKGAAPAGTVGYRLGLKVPKTVHWFPARDSKSRRWDGSFSSRPYFVLSQKEYEPPRVPKATQYIIHFVDASGELLPTPAMFASGILIAEASRMSWPGTHRVRESRGGNVRNLVDLGAGRSAGRIKVKPGK